MKYQILIILFAISLISSILLSVQAASGICKPDGGCDIVQNSEYDSTFGIRNSYYGIVIFAFMIILTLSHLKKPGAYKRTLIHLGVMVGAIVAIYFIYIQEFVLKTTCTYCMAVDISMIAALLVVIFSWRRGRRKWVQR